MLTLHVSVLCLIQLSSARYFGNYACSGRSDVIVHLFEWKWDDIAAECERYLGPNEYCGVQISPPNEHRVVDKPWRPWWQRFQPVSYVLESRSGNRDAFEKMVQRCNAVGVKVFADVIMNHMTGTGYGIGSGKNPWSGDTENYPAVPYGWSNDFNHYPKECPNPSGDIHDYRNPTEIRNCRMNGNRDLKQSQRYVREKIRYYLQELLDIGVAGFRLDAMRHVWPGDAEIILDGLNGTPYVYQDVKDLGWEVIKVKEYEHIGRVTEFKYGYELSRVIRKWDNQKLKYLKSFGKAWGFLDKMKALVFVDNHDNQRGGAPILSHKDSQLYRTAVIFELGWDYGHVRLMSSYAFDNRDQGPPSHSDGSTKDVVINNEGTCDNGWVCEHRWRQIVNMVKFHNMAIGKLVSNWWDNDNNQIAFSRGNVAFMAINREDYDMNVELVTGLPSGKYCDVISGYKDGGKCTGKTVNVNDVGKAQILIRITEEDSVVAIHLESKL